MTRKTILIVDDHPACMTATRHIVEGDYQIIEALSKDVCLKQIRKFQVDIVLLDLLMPNVIGFELLEMIKTISPQSRVIILTSEYDIEKAVEAIQKGAHDYLVKDAAIHTLPKRLSRLSASIDNEKRVEGFLAESRLSEPDFFIPDHPRYRECYDLAVRAAHSGLSILIQGNTGSGKEVLVKHIRKTVMKDAPIISVNCGAIPEALAESELFGTAAHAFTDAIDRKGKLELANGGILFLDEVGNMPISIQKKLLRAIESNVITRVGSDQEIRTHFLLISATNADLDQDMVKGQFREDLFFRINDVTIRLPSLYEVPEVIPQFVRYFVDLYNQKYNANFSPSTSFYRQLLLKLNGNIRSLKKEIQSAIALGLPHPQYPATPLTMTHQIDMIEKILIEDALHKYHNNISKAAEFLGVKRTTLHEKIKKFHS